MSALPEPESGRRKPRSRPTRAQTRQRIIDAALIVFGRDGIQAGSLDAVVVESGLSKGAIYSNFASKDDLVVALVQENALYRLEAGAAAAAEATDPREAISRLAASMTWGIKNDQVRNRLIAELYVLAYQNPDLAAALRDSRLRARAYGARQLQLATERLGFTLPMPAEQMIVVLLALGNGFAIEWGIDHDCVPDDMIESVLLPAVFGQL